MTDGMWLPGDLLEQRMYRSRDMHLNAQHAGTLDRESPPLMHMDALWFVRDHAEEVKALTAVVHARFVRLHEAARATTTQARKVA